MALELLSNCMRIDGSSGVLITFGKMTGGLRMCKVLTSHGHNYTYNKQQNIIYRIYIKGENHLAVQFISNCMRIIDGYSEEC